MEDFGENSYCSKQCYEATTNPTCGNDPNNVSLLRIDSDASRVANATSKASGLSKTNVGKPAQARRIRTKQTTYGSSGAEKSTRVAAPKSSAHKKNNKSPITTKPKRKTLAAGMKDELIRVARLTAERLMDANVAFAPTKEDWMPKKLYREAGTSYLLGHVTRYNIESKTNADNISVPSTAFQICWTSTAFQ
eukprot:jgi/Phyca11/128946/e_gw1.80.122.1